MTDKGQFLRRTVTAAAIAPGILAILPVSSPSKATPIETNTKTRPNKTDSKLAGQTNLSPAAVIPVNKKITNQS